MSTFQIRAAAALAKLPEEMQEQALGYLQEQGEKWRILKALVDEGLEDVAKGDVEDWDKAAFLSEAEADFRARAKSIKP